METGPSVNTVQKVEPLATLSKYWNMQVSEKGRPQSWVGWGRYGVGWGWGKYRVEVGVGKKKGASSLRNSLDISDWFAISGY